VTADKGPVVGGGRPRRGICWYCKRLAPYTYALGLEKVAEYPEPVERRICKTCVKEQLSK